MEPSALLKTGAGAEKKLGETESELSSEHPIMKIPRIKSISCILDKLTTLVLIIMRHSFQDDI
jgi:hypothetical protein